MSVVCYRTCGTAQYATSLSAIESICGKFEANAQCTRNTIIIILDTRYELEMSRVALMLEAIRLDSMPLFD